MADIRLTGIRLLLVGCTIALTAARTPLVVLVLDGFRWDYPEVLLGDEFPDSTMHMLEESGVRAEHVHPGFPSVSYPSWTTIATGRFSEVHGIVGNHMYDTEVGDFSLNNHTLTGKSEWWNSGSDPIWTTATKQNIRTANIMFSRCDVAIGGVKPAFCQPYVAAPGREVLHTNLETALSKLEQGYEFVIVYAEHLDTTGHNNIPTGSATKQAMKDVDDELKIFFDGLKRRKMFNKVNFIIVSDHGMTEVGPRVETNYVYLDLYLSVLLAQRIIDSGAFTQIIPLPGQQEKLLEELERMPNVTVYTRDEIPEYLHYSNNDRIPEILVLADPGSVIVAPQTDNTLPRSALDAWAKLRGIHGYTRNFTDMRTVFYAMGPDFKKGYRQPGMELVDEYQVMAHVLDMEPQPHNGSWQRVRAMFSGASSHGPAVGGATIAPLGALVLLLGHLWR